MSWSIEERIGEFRPFPAQVVVYKGNTDECLAYVSGEVADRLKAENDRLRELVRDMCKAFIHGPCYRWCDHMPEPCNGDKCQYVRRMRELGV